MSLMTKKRALHSVAAACLLALTACGGGETPTTPNTNNDLQNPPQQSATQKQSLEKASGVVGLIGTLDGAPSADLTRQEAAAELQTVAEILTANIGAQAITTTVFFCSSPATATAPAGTVDTGKGSVTTVKNDVDPVGPSTGDTVTMTFSVCEKFGRIINGTRSFTRNVATGTIGTPPWAIDVTRANDETITSAARTVTLKGTSNIVAGSADGLVTSRAVTGTSMQTSTPVAGGIPVRRERTFAITTTRDLNTQTYTTNANVSSTGPAGTNKIETTTPITGPLAFSPPTAGVIKITTTSTATPPVTSITIVTVMPLGQVQVQVDSNGDGVIDTTTTTTWTGLIGFGLNFLAI